MKPLRLTEVLSMTGRSAMFSKPRRIKERMNVRLSAGQWEDVRKHNETGVLHGYSCIRKIELHQYSKCYSRRVRRVLCCNAACEGYSTALYLQPQHPTIAARAKRLKLKLRRKEAAGCFH